MQPCTSSEIHTALSSLSVKELLSRMKGIMTIPVKKRAKKSHLIEHIMSYAPSDQLSFLCELSKDRRNTSGAQAVNQAAQQKRKRKRTEEQHTRCTARRVEDDLADGDGNVDPMLESFMTVPSEDERRACYRAFYTATSNAAVASTTCGVCAREVSVQADAVQDIPLHEIPNSNRLRPTIPHPAHTLYDGKLLDPRGVVVKTGGCGSNNDPVTLVTCCRECREALKTSSPLPPKLSLANGLWIGDVPWYLQVLTIPEQMLISLLFPRVFVFKLFPKHAGGGRDPTTLQRGMRGTVSTYALNADGMAAMVAGNLLPRPPAVLASVISVTFVGLGTLPKQWLRHTFRVRRQVVSEALRWLKANNKKYYGDIEINSAQILALPEDDVPEEVLSVTRQSEDVGLVVNEAEGYVPLERDEVLEEILGETAGVESSAESGDDPNVIPLQVSGIIDTDLTNLTANELMLWGLANLWKEGREGGYAVRHSRNPVSDFPERRPPNRDEPSVATSPSPSPPSNFFEKAFPCLYPYGCGGIEGTQPVSLDLREHVKWTLQYHDRRFRRDEKFPFVVFGIQQKRQALLSARLQMKRKDFDVDGHMLQAITPEKLAASRREEEENKPISDPAVRLLRKHIHATAGRVQGSDQSRYQLRSQIWATSISKGPPSLWITINPTDLHDPIAQIFAGEEIDLDRFVKTARPDKHQRASNIAADPYAAAKFFHFMVKTILSTLFGVEATPFQMKAKTGVLGKVSAYFGTVESQGRGSLHLHMLVWLEGSPTTAKMHELLKDEAFRIRVKSYIAANIRSFVPGLETRTDMKNTPSETDVAFSRPIHPDSPTFTAELSAFERRVARSQQVHTCDTNRCLVPTKCGRYRCKRRAPFELTEDDTIDDCGRWKSKRVYPYLNGWMPAILHNVRCNNDVKLLTNGADTKNCSFYITSYAAKKQQKHHNMSAIMAKGYAYHAKHTDYLQSLQDQQRLLLFRIVHTINREQEIAAPMVMSYLMGWGDCYHSHNYTIVYWASFVGAVLRAFPGILDADLPREGSSVLDPENPAEEHAPREQNHCDSADNTETIQLDTTAEGRLFTKSQVTDYALRGEMLEDMNIFAFFTDTYEIDVRERCQGHDDGDADGDHGDSDNSRWPGRRRNERFRYRVEHPKHGSKQRIKRTKGHNNIPNFVGRYFPRSDDPGVRSYFCASMLTLLKPWRDLKTDLKRPSETWSAAFERFVADAPVRTKNIISNIQYFHECQRAAEEDQSRSSADDVPAPLGTHRRDTMDEDWNLGEDGVLCEQEAEEDLLARLLVSQGSLAEELHGRLAVETAKAVSIFQDVNHMWNIDRTLPAIGNATGDDLARLQAWRSQMADDVNLQNALVGADTPTSISQQAHGDDGRVETLRIPSNSDSATVTSLGANEAAEASITPVDISRLKPDQFRAFDIVTWHLEKTLQGATPPPLRMIIHGEGGTGKSLVIQTITDHFAAKGAKHLLLKAAYTGVAASLIDGKTTHCIGMVSLNGQPMSAETKAKLQNFWRDYTYLVIDEISMISKTFLALLSRNIGVGKARREDADAPSSESFGGINVVLCGDFHQFPPVASGTSEALYQRPANPKDNKFVEKQCGFKIFEEFTTVVVLKEQIRVSDPVWHDFLQHLRYGRVQHNHITMLRKLVVMHPDCEPTNFSVLPWNNASLVTPRHGVRKQWNDAAILKHCEETGSRLFRCMAEDTIRGQGLTVAEQIGVARRGARQARGSNTQKKARRKDLPRQVDLAVGMKVMVTQNVQTDLDITNGARGEVVDIILHPDEPPFDPDQQITKLKYLPVYILVKLSHTRATRLEGLDDCVIPVEPATQTFQIKVDLEGSKSVSRTVKRRQFPVTAAYAFTDYRSQGQTIPYVLIDIATPPLPGTLSLFSLYVALSRSSGRGTIRLLRDFDDKLFMQSHSTDLLEFDDRLRELDTSTKLWWRKMGRDVAGPR